LQKEKLRFDIIDSAKEELRLDIRRGVGVFEEFLHRMISQITGLIT